MNRAYRSLLKASTRIGLPIHFVADLTTHDRAFCERNPEARFLWAVWDSGTHVIRTDVAPKGGVLPLVRCVNETFGNVAWFHWDGTQLHEIKSAVQFAYGLADGQQTTTHA